MMAIESGVDSYSTTAMVAVEHKVNPEHGRSSIDFHVQYLPGLSQLACSNLYVFNVQEARGGL